MKTILEVLNGATDFLEKRDIESARLNAQYLLAHVLKKKRMDLYVEFETTLAENDLAPMRDLLRERAAGRPLQHLLGTAEFFGREFLCDKRALIPRPETEQLIEKILEKEGKQALHILDVGTGSGVIAITLALECPDAQIFAIDASSEALDLAKANAQRLEVDQRIQFSHGDLIPAEKASYHYIVANLPYIPTGEIATLSQEVKHDPVAALDGGPDGTVLIKKLISKCPEFLEPGGRLYLEIGLAQAADLSAFLEAEKFRDIQAHRDYQGIERFLSATYG
ncbi:MAG: peptide chain release factor N(5)-glutamine methyltransferase [Chthoniobacterales bacterium]